MKNISDENIIELIFHVSKNLRGKMEYSSDLGNLSMSQFMTLLYIKKNKAISMKEISEHFSIEMSSATSVLNRLVSSKLVKRMTDKKDRRVVRLALTTQGEELFKKAIIAHKKKIQKVLSYLSDKQKIELYKILKVLEEKIS